MKAKLLDIYFKSPILFDYLIAIVFYIALHFIVKLGYFDIPSINVLNSIIADLANVSLTITGFILTLLTLLITFKSSSKLSIQDVTSSDSKFDIFFASNLYFETNRHLKNSIKSLLFISISGYIIKLASVKFIFVIHFFSVFILVVLILTLSRCLLILGMILDFQEKK